MATIPRMAYGDIPSAVTATPGIDTSVGSIFGSLAGIGQKAVGIVHAAATAERARLAAAKTAEQKRLDAASAQIQKIDDAVEVGKRTMEMDERARMYVDALQRTNWEEPQNWVEDYRRKTRVMADEVLKDPTLSPGARLDFARTSSAIIDAGVAKVHDLANARRVQRIKVGVGELFNLAEAVAIRSSSIRELETQVTKFEKTEGSKVYAAFGNAAAEKIDDWKSRVAVAYLAGRSRWEPLAVRAEIDAGGKFLTSVTTAAQRRTAHEQATKSAEDIGARFQMARVQKSITGYQDLWKLYREGNPDLGILITKKQEAVVAERETIRSGADVTITSERVKTDVLKGLDEEAKTLAAWDFISRDSKAYLVPEGGTVLANILAKRVELYAPENLRKPKDIRDLLAFQGQLLDARRGQQISPGVFDSINQENARGISKAAKKEAANVGGWFSSWWNTGEQVALQAGNKRLSTLFTDKKGEFGNCSQTVQTAITVNYIARVNDAVENENMPLTPALAQRLALEAAYFITGLQPPRSSNDR